MSNLKTLARLGTCVRAFTTAARRPATSLKEPLSSAQTGGTIPSNEAYSGVQRLQSEWGATEGDLMVWKKRGLRDSAPFQLTMVACVGALGLIVSVLWRMSWPKKTAA